VVAGLAEVVRRGYPDPTQFDPKDDHYDPESTPAAPRWYQVDVKAVRKLPRESPWRRSAGRRRWRRCRWCSAGSASPSSPSRRGVRADRPDGIEVIGPAALLALAAVIIALALQISSGQYDPRALALVTLATVAAMIGAAWRKRVVPERGAVLPQALLGFGCAVGLACNLFTNPTLYADPARSRAAFAGSR